MNRLISALLVTAAVLIDWGLVDALPKGIPIFGACQYMGSSLKSAYPKLGCPPGTIFVSQTSGDADYTTVNDALATLPADLSPRWILIDEGEYKESLNISRKGPTTLLGVTSTLVPQDYTSNLVTIHNNLYMNTSDPNKLDDNGDTSVLNIAPNKYAAWTGAGFFGLTIGHVNDVTQGNLPHTSYYADPGGSTEFGTKDFKAYNLNFENRAVNKSQGPALALNLGYVRASFYGCTFRSWQDTIFVGKNASAYFTHSQVLGQTDFIYGFGTAWFNNSTLGLRGPGGYVTAWKGVPDDRTVPNGYTNDGNHFGAYIWNSSIVKSPDADPTVDITGKFTLGRPWNNISRTIVQYTYLDSSIAAQGFSTWSANTYDYVKYFEYENYGPGWKPDERIYFDHVLTREEANNFTLSKAFEDDLSWIDLLY